MTPVGAPMKHDSEPKAFCHIVIPAPDLDKAKSFYERVFGWKVQEGIRGRTSWFFSTGNVGGAFSASNKPAAKSVVLVLRVNDIEDALLSVRAHGGVVTREKSRIGDADPGFDAYFTDPNGNEM